jgi:hypothetical protein
MAWFEGRCAGTGDDGLQKAGDSARFQYAAKQEK